jgi:hypothetical protein
LSFALTWERWRLAGVFGDKAFSPPGRQRSQDDNRLAVAHWWRVKELIRNFSETLPAAAGYSP